MTVEKQIREFLQWRAVNEGNNNHVIHKEGYSLFIYYHTTIAVRTDHVLYILENKISVSTTRRQKLLNYHGTMNGYCVKFISSDEMQKYKW